VSGDRPVIGLTGYATPATWGVWDTRALLLPWSYVDAVAAAGGLPVVLPPQPGIVDAVLDRLDGLILSGGPDVEPSWYGRLPGPDTQRPSPERDAAELALVVRALGADLPVLGICRGMQVLNVARGGSLHQHLPDVLGHTGHAVAPGVYRDHPVRVAEGSRLAGLLRRTEVDAVPSYHHQGIERLGAGLVPTAWAPDGAIEAVEDPTRAFCVAVQWHPEVGTDPALFAGIVEAARHRSGSR
jgi:putative glutamine amidotransferase